MKRILSVLFILMMASSITAAEKIRLTSGEWPPYLSQKLKKNGFASAIVTEAFALVGVEGEYGFFPWKRSYTLAKDGEWDGSVIWGCGEERRELFYCSDPIVKGESVFFHRKVFKFSWESFDDLERYRLGGLLGYDYIFDDKDKNIKLEETRDEVSAFRMLLAGRIDVFLSDLDVGYDVLNKKFKKDEIKKITHYPKAYNETNYSILLSRKIPGNEEMIKRFNRGLKMLKESGRYDQIINDSREGKFKKR